jgi:hypothetical protein
MPWFLRRRSGTDSGSPVATHVPSESPPPAPRQIYPSDAPTQLLERVVASPDVMSEIISHLGMGWQTFDTVPLVCRVWRDATARKLDELALFQHHFRIHEGERTGSGAHIAHSEMERLILPGKGEGVLMGILPNDSFGKRFSWRTNRLLGWAADSDSLYCVNSHSHRISKYARSTGEILHLSSDSLERGSGLRYPTGIALVQGGGCETVLCVSDLLNHRSGRDAI